jgi:hypothetical protein
MNVIPSMTGPVNDIALTQSRPRLTFISQPGDKH